MSEIIALGGSPEAESLLDTFHRAAATSDLNTYFGCFHREGRFLGTDASENWHVNDFLQFCRPIFATSTCAWEYKPIAGSRKITYFDGFCIFDELLESVSFKATSRGSGTLILDRERKVWLIASYHLTFPIPNDIAVELTSKIHQFEMKVKSEKAQLLAQELIEEWNEDADKNISKQGSSSKNKKKNSKRK